MSSRGRGSRGRGSRGVGNANVLGKQHGGNTTPKGPWSLTGQRDAGPTSTVNQSAAGILKPESMTNASQSKYDAACAKIRKNLEKFMDAEGEESSSSEEDLDDNGIIQKTFRQYTADDDAREIKKTQEFLQDSLTSGALVCLICIESIKRNHPIWSCKNCYAMLHVSCVEKWAKDSLYHQSSSADDNIKKESLKWCCPKCRHEYKPAEKPSRYFCFCGKVENPTYDPWTLPHSCGQICEKKLVPFCGHECLLLCHPGPCPPCPKTVEKSCYCNKSKPITRRCSNQDWSCGKPCGHLLFCGQHKCETPCHPGECPSCTKQSEQNCNCGSKRKLRPCDQLEWQCDKVCGKQLDCGHHCCQLVCHKGKCSPCSRSGPRPCPCNKKVSWLPCTEEVPPCGDTCGKLLECEIHYCSQRCHFGPCGACLQMRVMKCRCGQREKSVPCCKEYTCDIKCKKKRDCGKHNCNRKCCVGSCPACEAPCGRPLNCFNHKCQSRCHSGPCYPCRETTEIKCNCGSTKIVVPCGRRKSAIPPKCPLDCKLPSECHHPQRHKHRCHFGVCPPCRLICRKSLNCGHTCPSKCHSAVLTKVEINKKKEGPWDLLNSFKMESVCKPCPPCLVPIPLACRGKHEVQDFPCSEVRPWSCGRPCGRPLSCGNHFCKLECHDVDSSDDSSMSDKCQPCEEQCSKERPEGCTHPCPRACHPDPCSLCKKLLKMRCHCQLNSMYVSCNEWITADSSRKEEMLSCKNRCPKELSCGHRCPLVCHPERCPGREICKKKVTIRCLCKRIKQEVQCNTTVSSSVQLSCDEECRVQQEKEQAARLAEELKKKEEEERKQELEIKEYQKKFEGKKKKHKKQKVVEESSSNYKQYLYLVIILLLVGFAAFVICNKYK